MPFTQCQPDQNPYQQDHNEVDDKEAETSGPDDDEDLEAEMQKYLGPSS